MPKLLRAGFSLVELMAVLTLVGLLLGAGVPRFDRIIGTYRVQASLNLIAAQIYLARMTAVRTGHSSELVLSSDAGCVTALRNRTAGGATGVRIALSQSRPCVTHSGDSVLRFNSRGMLHPPTRSIYAREATFPDTLRLSIAGRIRRSY